MTPEEVADRLEIQEALLAYSTALDIPGRRWDDWERCFAPDALCDFSHGGSGLPPDLPYRELREIFEKNTPMRLSSQHLLMNSAVVVDGDSATARTECLVIGLSRTDSDERIDRNLSSVWYEDVLARTVDGWRITHRTCRPRWGTRSDVRADELMIYLEPRRV